MNMGNKMILVIIFVSRTQLFINFIMSKNFAEFLFENADTGSDLLAILDDIVSLQEEGNITSL